MSFRFDPAHLVPRLLDVIEQDIVPLTRREVQRGNKIFGAAILRKSDLSLVIAETNNEVENPLWHGEMHAIKRLYERPRESCPTPSNGQSFTMSCKGSRDILKSTLLS